MTQPLPDRIQQRFPSQPSTENTWSLTRTRLADSSGYDQYKVILQEEASGEHLSVIALTGSSARGDRERCPQSGFDDSVLEPVHGELLLEAIG
jgi:CheY-like chemotaxis protein